MYLYHRGQDTNQEHKGIISKPLFSNSTQVHLQVLAIVNKDINRSFGAYPTAACHLQNYTNIYEVRVSRLLYYS